MFSQSFGNFILNKGYLTKNQVLEALSIERETHVKIGVLAVNSGKISAEQVDQIHLFQQSTDKRFGEIAIEKGYLYPYLTIQAYISENNELLSYAIAKTEDIINAIDNGLCYKNHTSKNQIGQAESFVVKWYDMKKAGYEIIIKEKEEISYG